MFSLVEQPTIKRQFSLHAGSVCPLQTLSVFPHVLCALSPLSGLLHAVLKSPRYVGANNFCRHRWWTGMVWRDPRVPTLPSPSLGKRGGTCYFRRVTLLRRDRGRGGGVYGTPTLEENPDYPPDTGAALLLGDGVLRKLDTRKHLRELVPSLHEGLSTLGNI